MGDRIGQCPELGQCIAQVIVALGGVLSDFKGFVVTCDCLGHLTLLRQGTAQVYEGFRVFGFDLQGHLIMANSVDQSLLLFQIVAKVVVGSFIPGGLAHRIFPNSELPAVNDVAQRRPRLARH